IMPMFREAQRIAGKNPTSIISDGALNFAEATKIFYVKNIPADQRTRHIRDITFDGERHNNKMEAMNGQTVRQREKVIRGVKKVDSPIFQGAQIYHNFIRPHLALGEKTPAEVAGIMVKGEDRWTTLIQNAQLTKVDSGKLGSELTRT
ncbi:MAG: hypothetical protein ACRDF4_10810, partial [Rhabdochlamydiaceae bacterium]